MNGRIVKIGWHYYRIREARDWLGRGPWLYFDLLYWVEEAP